MYLVIIVKIYQLTVETWLFKIDTNDIIMLILPMFFTLMLVKTMLKSKIYLVVLLSVFEYMLSWGGVMLFFVIKGFQDVISFSTLYHICAIFITEFFVRIINVIERK